MKAAQPFSIITANIRERPRNAADDHFFIGGYDWDGSYLYIDKRTSTVHYCDRDDATSPIPMGNVRANAYIRVKEDILTV